MSLKILILGINGFIGHRLTETILSKTDWEVYGMDFTNSRLENCIRYPRLHFQSGDINIEKKWVEDHIKKCDVILPLAAIANPAIYVLDPIKIFKLDFETNLEIVKLCLTHHKRLVFPSTSEVYGMCNEKEFDEENSNLITGPIKKERWIYSTCKQLLDRVIYAYGNHDDLQFTLFRPFNWIGPKQDEVFTKEAAQSRVVSKFISDIVHGKNIELVNGGTQRRCFTYIDDGIEALIKIIENKDNSANGRIFNIGNPNNNWSIGELAEKIKTMAMEYPKYGKLAEKIEIIKVDEKDFYGKGYQDVQGRVPAIKNAEKYLNWKPKTDMNISLRNILDFYLS